MYGGRACQMQREKISWEIEIAFYSSLLQAVVVVVEARGF